MKRKKERSINKETFAYTNWKKWNNKQDEWWTFEYPLFTDAHVIGELTENLGPYKFFNTVPSSFGECIAPSIILRIEQPAWNGSVPSMKETDVSSYHGGTVIDELAALLSLLMGIRLKAGKLMRTFYPGNDPKGRPSEFGMIPHLITQKSIQRPVVPRIRGTHHFPKPDLLQGFLELKADDAVALVRACRLYQDALWICEYQAALSWLMMVSALETAAFQWKREMETPVERLCSSKPELKEILLNVGGDNHLNEVAEIIAPYMGATKKFIDFVLEYLPEPPSSRPPNWARCKWDKRSMKNTMKVIYYHRSKALHGGIPFPAPMCDPPMKTKNNLAEKPLGTASSSLGGIWVASDLPMVLNTFVYVVRGVLLNWWKSLLNL